jgi:nucleoside-diphosphate kinase
MIEKTVFLIKPDASSLSESIVALLRLNSFTIVARKPLVFKGETVDAFYPEHVDKPYYEAHRDFMTSGTTMAFVLEGEDAVARLRGLLGATDPEKAAPDTWRHIYGTRLPMNGFHGSDSVERALLEKRFLFSGFELGEAVAQKQGFQEKIG